MTLGEEIYKPKSILVTGGAGFIASHVTTKLVKRFPDCKVIFTFACLSIDKNTNI